jgi:peptidoglycan/LPS O-acetylase OafA/YrhL
MRITYRPEIDGLRAISVFAVILYHANFNLFGKNIFNGGFIGVDIFFVISGYLITTIILKEIYVTNNFSLKKFYERRIRRILPALLFLMMICSFAGYFILLPSSYIDFSKSLITSIFFSSNFYFWITGKKYGSEDELLKPLAHTWSLSVEEQFYILFPIFLLIIIKYFRKYLSIFLFAYFFISLIFAEYFSRNHASFSFYSLSSRSFELLLGSIISYLMLNKYKIHKSYPILNLFCPSLGIILIFYSFIFFNFEQIVHPAITTLVPVIGTALIIFFSRKGELITEILSNKILVFFGLISYSLYLWHYPVFAYLRYFYLFYTNEAKLLAIFMVFIISISCYYFIEKPFRNKNTISIKNLIIYIVITAAILLISNFYIIKSNGIKSRLPSNIDDQKLQFTGEILHSKNGKLGNVVLIGDSHAGVLEYHLNEELKKKSYNLFTFIKPGPMLLYINNFNRIDRKTKKIDHEFLEDNNKIDDFLKKNSNLIIIFSYKYGQIMNENTFNQEDFFRDKTRDVDQHDANSNKFYITPKYLEPVNIITKTNKERQEYIVEGLKLTFNDIIKQGHKIIIVYPVPVLSFNLERLINSIKHDLFSSLSAVNISTNYNSYKLYNKKLIESFNSIQNSNIYKVYPDKSFCSTSLNRCIANNKEHLFYFDDNHLSLEGSKYVVKDIIKEIQQIEIDKKISK